VGDEEGNVVLTSRLRGAGADVLTALVAGSVLTISWNLRQPPGVADVIGGQPTLVNDGVNVAPLPSSGSSYFLKNNPRTGIGITQGCSDTDLATRCDVIYMVVDGRRDGWSVGMNLREFGREMLRFGAYDAVNLDGGGSSVMWLHDKGPWCITNVDNGCLVNKPSDGGQRSLSTAMLVLQGPDANEPPIGDAERTSIWTTGFDAPDHDSANRGMPSLTDPGSTGGLLDALAEQGRLPDGFGRYLRTYRTAPRV
jgi:hypothetical protein